MDLIFLFPAAIIAIVMLIWDNRHHIHSDHWQDDHHWWDR